MRLIRTWCNWPWKRIVSDEWRRLVGMGCKVTSLPMGDRLGVVHDMWYGERGTWYVVHALCCTSGLCGLWQCRFGGNVALGHVPHVVRSRFIFCLLLRLRHDHRHDLWNCQRYLTQLKYGQGHMGAQELGNSGARAARGHGLGRRTSDLRSLYRKFCIRNDNVCMSTMSSVLTFDFCLLYGPSRQGTSQHRSILLPSAKVQFNVSKIYRWHFGMRSALNMDNKPAGWGRDPTVEQQQT